MRKLEKRILNFIWKFKGCRLAKMTWGKKKAGGLTLSDFKTSQLRAIKMV